MRPLTKKLFELGIVDKTVASMLEHWGSLEPGESDKVNPVTPATKAIFKMLDELDEIISREGFEKKETKFEVTIKKAPVILWESMNGPFPAVEDEFGHFIVGPKIILRLGCLIHNGPTKLRIVDFSPLYEGDEVIAQQVVTETTCD